MATKFWKDEELQRFGQEVLQKHHEDKVGGANFLFIFRDTETADGPSRSSKVNPVFHALGVKDDFIIEVHEGTWSLLHPAKREALLDHALAHCGVIRDAKSGTYKYFIAQHDLEDFLGVFSRHGAWQDSLAELINIGRQMELFGNNDRVHWRKENGKTIIEISED